IYSPMATFFALVISFPYVLLLALLSHLKASNGILSSFLYQSQCKSLAESSFYLKLLVSYLKVCFQVFAHIQHTAVKG
ncbi:MAG: hypothetical protein ACLVB4_05320, partial [Butyricicoccus sp.]